MEQIRKFLRDKGFALALLACLVAAAAAGVWAVRTVRDELDKNLSGLKTPDSTSTAPGIDEGLSTTTPQEDETTWEWPTEPAANSVSNVPKAASSASRSASSVSSAPQAGSGSVREPSALQGASSPASSSAAPASTQPVSGRVLNGYSGDELVYNKTLGDWRTHNGIDYACAKDAVVLLHFQVDMAFLGAFTADAAHFAQCLPGTDRLALFHRRAGHAAEPPDTARTVLDRHSGAPAAIGTGQHHRAGAAFSGSG